MPENIWRLTTRSNVLPSIESPLYITLDVGPGCNLSEFRTSQAVLWVWKVVLTVARRVHTVVVCSEVKNDKKGRFSFVAPLQSRCHER